MEEKTQPLLSDTLLMDSRKSVPSTVYPQRFGVGPAM